MGRWGMVLVAAATVFAAASARAQTERVAVLAPVAFKTHALPANAVTSFTAACARGYVATSAGVSRPGPGTTLLAVAPSGARAYRFRFGNPPKNGRQRVTVALACRRVAGAAGKVVLRIRPVRRTVVIAARRTASVRLACPMGTVPGGAGSDVDPDRRQAVNAYRETAGVTIRRQTSSLTAFGFSAQNSSLHARRVVLYGSCVTVARAAGAPAGRLHLQVTTERVAVAPGAQGFTRRCAAGWFPVAAGFALRSSVATVTASAPTARGGRWTIVSDAAAGTTADLQLACARLAP